VKIVLITGANGFLGTEIVRQAIDAGMEVRATDRLEAPTVGRVNYCQADILDLASLSVALNGIEGVIHAAGLAHIFNKEKADFDTYKSFNEIGTLNIARASAQSGVKHFLLISSVSVYGPYNNNRVSEDFPCHPAGPYAESKYLAEQRAIEVAKQSGMNVTILRLATAYGEGDPGNVGRLMRTIDQGRFIWIGSGSNRKSLIHREDVARACLAVLQDPPEGICIFNVCAPPCTMREVVEGLAKELNRPVPRWSIPASLALGIAYMGKTLSFGHGRLGGFHATIKKWLADDIYDSSEFEKTFNLKTQVNLSEGLRREVAWYLNHNPQSCFPTK
jgi:nucleoside-diphosphate-sugar epimerase